MGTTAKGLRYPEAADSNNVPVDMQELAQDADDRLPAAMTTAVRDALAGSSLWDGRTIWNSTNGRRERYDAGALAWREESVSTSGGSTITASAATVIPLVVKGAASQSADLLQARDSGDVVRAKIDKFGDLHVGGSAVYGVGAAQFVNSAAAQRVLVVRGAASQTANLAEFQDSAGNVKVAIGPATGQLFVGQGASGFTLGGTSSGAAIAVGTPNATSGGLLVRGVASQTANLAEFQNDAGSVVAAIGAAGSLQLGNNGITGSNVIAFEAGTAPTANLADGGYLYCDGTGRLLWRGGSGTVTVIAPA